MGVRLLSSIFGKSPSPAPVSDSLSGNAAKSPLPKPRTPLPVTKDISEEQPRPRCESESDIKKRSSTKLGIGVGGNVLAEMKAKQERRVSGILRQTSEDSEVSERNELKSRAEDSDSAKLNPLAIKLRPVTATTPEDESKPPLRPKLRSTGLNNEEGDKQEPKPNLLSGVKLRSTGINVTENISNANGSGDSGLEARNLALKTRPPPLAPKPRPWSIVSPDKQPDDIDDEPPPLKPKLKNVGGNLIPNQDLPEVVATQRSHVATKEVEDQVDKLVDAVNSKIIVTPLQFLDDLSMEDAVDV